MILLLLLAKANSFNKLKESLVSLNFQRENSLKNNKQSLNLSISNNSHNESNLNISYNMKSKRNSRYAEFINFYRIINNILNSK